MRAGCWPGCSTSSMHAFFSCLFPVPITIITQSLQALFFIRFFPGSLAAPGSTKLGRAAPSGTQGSPAPDAWQGRQAPPGIPRLVAPGRAGPLHQAAPPGAAGPGRARAGPPGAAGPGRSARSAGLHAGSMLQRCRAATMIARATIASSIFLTL